MTQTLAEVDQFLTETTPWQAELTRLRSIVLACGLTEAFKWRQPCYTDNGKNILILSNFKQYCAIGFFKGVLLNDPDHLLEKPGENSQHSRILCFTSVQQIDEMVPIINAFIAEAVANEKAGKKVKVKDHADYEIPAELEEKFIETPALREAFYNLTPGRQRGYILNIAAAKQSKTRFARIEKYADRIYDGKGIFDCVCGHSKRLPSCDGSHKYL